MTDVNRLERRLSAVERTLLDDDRPFDDLAEVAAVTETVERLEERLAAFERQLAELEATTQSLESFLDAVECVNGDIERQANVAVASVDRLEDRLAGIERRLDESVRHPADDGRTAIGSSPTGDGNVRSLEDTPNASEAARSTIGSGATAEEPGGRDGRRRNEERLERSRSGTDGRPELPESEATIEQTVAAVFDGDDSGETPIPADCGRFVGEDAGSNPPETGRSERSDPGDPSEADQRAVDDHLGETGGGTRGGSDTTATTGDDASPGNASRGLLSGVLARLT